jgi:signal peptidase I
MPPRSTASAVGIALLVSLVVGPVIELEAALLDSEARNKVVAAFVAAPLRTLIAIYVPSCVVYLLALVGPQQRARFGTVVRCLAYAQLPLVAGIIPFIGPFIVFFWSIWLVAFALRHALGRSWLFSCVATLAAPALLMTFGLMGRTVKEAFKIPSPGMAPTLLVGDHIFVSKTAYGWISPRLPGRGDVIVFRFPEKPEQDFIKRVIGLPGDRIEIQDGKVLINGWAIPTCTAGPARVPLGDQEHPGQVVVEFLDRQAYVVIHDTTIGTTYGARGPYQVADGQVFVFGDNRENSYDSPMWYEGKGGGVPVGFVKGRASSVWMSFAPEGIRWQRLGIDLTAAPPCSDLLEPETCAGLKRCMENRPPLSATTPPRG